MKEITEQLIVYWSLSDICMYYGLSSAVCCLQSSGSTNCLMVHDRNLRKSVWLSSKDQEPRLTPAYLVTSMVQLTSATRFYHMPDISLLS